MTKLIAQMVVRNEADRFLDEVLEHTRGFVDEIIVTDDASTDNTPEIAKRYTDYVYRNDETLFVEDEGRLRQTAWDNLSNHASEGDVILCLDADEKLFFTDLGLEDLFRTKFNVFGITFYHMWNESHFRVDKAWAPVVSSRMFRFYEGGFFRDRRLACGSEPIYIQDFIRSGSFLQNTGMMMQHLGYLRDEDKQAKYERYMSLDKGEFHSLQHLQSILDPHPVLASWDETIQQRGTKPQKDRNVNQYIIRG